MEISNISLEKIVPSKTNPRKNFDEGQMKDLTESIKQRGILQPILVRPIGENGNRIFEIIAGERRFRAAKSAGLSEIPAIQKELSDSEVMEEQVIENLQRSDLHPLEEANGYKGLMDKHGYSADDIALKVGKSKAYIYSRLKLLALCAPAKKYFLEGRLTPSVALLFARIPDLSLQKQAVDEIFGEGEEPTYSQVLDHISRRYMMRLENAPFDSKSATLLPKAGACTTCPKRTGNQQELFSDIKRADICTDVLCFQKKKESAWVLTAKNAKEQGLSVIEGAEADKLCPYGHIEQSSGYIDFNAQCYDDPKGRTWKQILKKSAPPVTLLRNKREEVHEIVRKTELIEALKKSGVELKKESSDGKMRESMAKQRQQGKLKQAVAFKAVEVAVKKLEGYDLKDFSALIMPLVFRNANYEALWVVAKRRGLVQKRSEDSKAKLQKEIANLSEAQRKGFIAELLVSCERWSSYSGFGENFKFLCKDTNIDLQKIETEVKVTLNHAKKRR